MRIVVACCLIDSLRGSASRVSVYVYGNGRTSPRIAIGITYTRGIFSIVLAGLVGWLDYANPEYLFLEFSQRLILISGVLVASLIVLTNMPGLTLLLSNTLRIVFGAAIIFGVLYGLNEAGAFK